MLVSNSNILSHDDLGLTDNLQHMIKYSDLLLKLHSELFMSILKRSIWI